MLPRPFLWLRMTLPISTDYRFRFSRCGIGEETEHCCWRKRIVVRDVRPSRWARENAWGDTNHLQFLSRRLSYHRQVVVCRARKIGGWFQGLMYWDGLHPMRPPKFVCGNPCHVRRAEVGGAALSRCGNADDWPRTQRLHIHCFEKVRIQLLPSCLTNAWIHDSNFTTSPPPANPGHDELATNRQVDDRPNTLKVPVARCFLFASPVVPHSPPRLLNQKTRLIMARSPDGLSLSRRSSQLGFRVALSWPCILSPANPTWRWGLFRAVAGWAAFSQQPHIADSDGAALKPRNLLLVTGHDFCFENSLIRAGFPNASTLGLLLTRRSRIRAHLTQRPLKVAVGDGFPSSSLTILSESVCLHCASKGQSNPPILGGDVAGHVILSSILPVSHRGKTDVARLLTGHQRRALGLVQQPLASRPWLILSFSSRSLGGHVNRPDTSIGHVTFRSGTSWEALEPSSGPVFELLNDPVHRELVVLLLYTR